MGGLCLFFCILSVALRLLGLLFGALILFLRIVSFRLKAVGLLQVALPLQPPHFVAVAGYAALRIPNAGELLIIYHQRTNYTVSTLLGLACGVHSLATLCDKVAAVAGLHISVF